jgi:hypothetical protein
MAPPVVPEPESSPHPLEERARDFRRARLAALINEYEAEHGVITEKELEAIREEWRE